MKRELATGLRFSQVWRGCLMVAVFAYAGVAGLARAQDDGFGLWVSDLRVEALAEGIISGDLFDEVFADIAPIERIIELDRKQPEFTLSFAGYYLQRVTDERVAEGRELALRHRALLAEVEARYGVPPEVVVAFWGMETAYGKYFGKYNTIEALATLAYDERRSRFFRKELLVALSLLEEGALSPAEYRGSWAGAVGHMQFMPSTYLNWAVDGDGDGKRNLYASLPDAFHSAGAFLQGLGWKRDLPWGGEVALPQGFSSFDLASVRTPPEILHPTSYWHSLGITRADGGALVNGTDGTVNDATKAALLLPSGASGPAFLVYENYRRILNWNRSRLYALAVGHLSDQIAGGPSFARPPRQEERVRITEIRQLQADLARLGFYTREIDGVMGSGTRAAIAAFQTAQGLPADGHLNKKIIDLVNKAITK
ncbi:MAG: lytic murein transglycosylase [Alphaproteobacteria bacterium]